MRVVPSPDLNPTEYLPGVPADGADLPDKEAKDLIARGLAVEAKEDKKPAAPAKTQRE